MIKYARLFFSFMSPSSFWFLKVDACYFILTEDLALCTSYRRASLINFHYWLEMKKKKTQNLFTFFLKKTSPTILFGISPVETKDPSTPSFLFPCALTEKWFVLWQQWNFTNNTPIEKKFMFRCGVGCCRSLLQTATSNNRNKANVTCEHNCTIINFYGKVLKWKISFVTILIFFLHEFFLRVF